MINWEQISEVEFLDMLEDKYVADGYAVDNMHNRRELGVDLLAIKDDEQIIILAKINPVQSDLSQPPLAKQNYPSATRYVYYYVGHASAPFVSVMRSTHPDFELNNEDETEREMFGSNSIFIFRFLIKYSLTISKIAKLIQKAYTAEPSEEIDVTVDETLFRIVLEAHEGIVQIREVNKTAITALRQLLDEYQDRNNENLIEKVKQSTVRFVSRLDEVSNKLNRLLELNSNYLYRLFRGSSIWGSTYNGAFLPVNLDTGDCSRYANRDEKRHFYRILDYMVVGFREISPHYLWGVTEAVGCFICLEDILGSLKRASENLIRTIFNYAQHTEETRR